MAAEERSSGTMEEKEPEPMDEEQALFASIEKSEAQESAANADSAQSEEQKGVTAAPKLLQDALKKGEVNDQEQKKDDSDEAAGGTGREQISNDNGASHEEKKGDDEDGGPAVVESSFQSKVCCSDFTRSSRSFCESAPFSKCVSSFFFRNSKINWTFYSARPLSTPALLHVTCKSCKIH